MWNVIKLITKRRYEDIINELANLPESEERNRRLEKAIVKYYELCAKSNLKNTLHLNNKLWKVFIIESSPIMFPIELEQCREIAEKLKNILKVNNDTNELVDGITTHEAETLLKTVVGYVRNDFQKESKDISCEDLSGLCGYAQLLSLYPFYSLGLPVTINNVRDFPEVNINYHAYGTVSFPIKEKDKVAMVTYLVDTTYRQFFGILHCNHGTYYNRDEIKGRMAAPDVGYFIIQSVEGREFATELLKKGFILLNPKNAYLYGHSFSNSIASARQGKDVDVAASPNDYYNAIFTYSEYFDYNNLEIAKMLADGTIIDLNSPNLIESR